MNTNKKVRSIILVFILLTICLIISTNVLAQDLKEEFPEDYKRWLQLEDKENYIEPLPYTVTYDKENSAYQNTTAYAENNLKTSYPEKYTISGLQVKDQQNTSQCWAFSATNMLESNLIKKGVGTSVFSPKHIDYSTSYTFLDGINPKGYKRELKSGGNAILALGYVTRGDGPVLEESMPFDNSEEKINLSQIQNKTVISKVKDYKQFPSIYKDYTSNGVVYHNGYSVESGARKEYSEQEVQEMRNNIKKHLIEKGAIAGYTVTANSTQYYNLDKVKQGIPYSYYCNQSTASLDHAITIVGWDDTYSKENFNDANKPSKDGAYIILNTYGEGAFNKGYLYISYEDTLIEKLLVGIVDEQYMDTNKIYQHDELGFSKEYNLTLRETSEVAKTVYLANVFERDTSKKENLTSISYYINSPHNIQIYANTQSDDLTKMELIEDLGAVDSGYHSYDFSKHLELTGSKFAIAIRYNNNDGVHMPLECNILANGGESGYWDTAKSNAGETFMSADQTHWTDLKDTQVKEANACIKAFTQYEENVPVENIKFNLKEIEVKKGTKTVVSPVITPTNATNKKVKWTVDNPAIANIAEDGTITAIEEGETTLTVETLEGGKKDTCKIIVTKEGYTEVEKITLSTNSETILVGQTVKINVKVMPEDATNKDISWSSTDEKIATVDAGGNIKGISEGIATITAQNPISKVQESCVVTVKNQQSSNKPNNSDDDVQKPTSEYQLVASIGNNKSASTTFDNTRSKTSLPKAGKTGFFIILFFSTSFMIIYGIKCYKNRDIK